MSAVPINASSKKAGAPTPINTPVATSVLGGGNAPPTLSRPTVPTLEEEDMEEIRTGDPAVTRSLLAGLVQGKLQGLIGRSSGYIEKLPDPIKKTVEGLKGLDSQYDDLYKEFKLESLEIEKKYAAKYAPLFARRAAIIAGTEKPTEEELTRGEEVARKDFGPEHDHDDDDDEEEEHEHYVPLTHVKPSDEGVPDFWLTALRNHVGISELVTERDAPALSKLKDVRVAPFTGPNGNGFKLEFEFAPNEWFTNQILSKSYYYQEELSYGGELSYKRAEGTEINWKDDDKDLTKSFEIKKQRNKNTNRTRLVRKAHPAESFFNFFSPPKPPTEEEEENMDEDELEELEQQLELDYQIGEDLKERVVPKAIDFFTGKALEYEDFDDDEDDVEGFDDEDEEGDEDDEEESDDDNEPPAARRRRPAAPGAGAAPSAEDCKQQ